MPPHATPRHPARLFLFGMATIVPGLAMLAAHYFPWRALLGRDLGRIECYSWGTAWIMGISTAGMRISARLGQPLPPADCARLVELSAVSAGVCTVAAYAIDHWSGLRRRDFAAAIANRRRQESRSGQ